MKKYIYIYISIVIAIGLFTSCTTDDIKPLIVQTDNLNAEVALTAIPGDTIGVVPGTSNRGTVRYAITSQTPAGIFDIGEIYGELIVSSDAVADLELGSTIALQVSVSKEGVSQTSNVEVTVVPPPVDVTPWVGTLIVGENTFLGYAEIEVPSSDNGDGSLTLSGGDPFNRSCRPGLTDIIITFEPLTSAGQTTGVVTIERMDYSDCFGIPLEIDGTGTYNTETKEIIIDYNLIGDGFTIPGTKTITPKE